MRRLLTIPLALLSFACASAPAPAPTSTPAHDASPAPAPDIDGATAHKLVSEGAILVDVRTAKEYADKHVGGAINVPVDDVATHDFGDKEKPIVVYCGSGRRAARAAEALKSRGYTHVKSMGGMSNWDK